MRILHIIILVLVFESVLGQDTSYIRIGNESGFDLTLNYKTLVDTAYSLKQILPEEYQDDFNVFGTDVYLHVPTFDDGIASIEVKLIDTIQSISPYYLTFIRVSNENGLFQKLLVDLNVPFDVEYPCLDIEWIERTKRIVASEALAVLIQNDYDPARVWEAELKAMRLFKSELSHALYCCTTRTSCSILCSTDKTVQFLTQKPSVAPGDLNNIEDLVSYLNAYSNEGRFIELEGIYDVVLDEADYDKLDFSESSLEEFSIECKLDVYGENVVNITDWLEDLAIKLEAIQKTHKITIHYFDPSNIGQIYLPDFGSSRSSSRGEATFDYEEDIIVINCGDVFPLRVLSRIKTDHFASRGGENIDSGQAERAQRVLPALIARELIRRAFMAGTSVIFNVGVEVTIDKIFVHGNECTWRDAWNSVEISVWDIMVWSAEGAIGFKKGNEMASALFGGFTSAFQYLMNTPSEEFSVEEVLSIFITNSFLGLVSGSLGECAGRVYKKFADHLSFEDKVINNEEFNKVARIFLSKPGTIKAWKEVVDEGFDEIRVDEDALDAISKSISSGQDGIDPLLDASQTLNSNKWNRVKDLYARGNAFNQKANDNSWWPEREITVEHPDKVYPPGHSKAGKPRRFRLDGYDPILGKRVSRKATTFDDITEDTWIKYLNEIDSKYPVGAIIKKPGSPLNNQPLFGDMILEVPEIVNLGSAKRERFEKLAFDRGITVVYKPE